MSVTVYTPKVFRPEVMIPYNIAKDFMEYGAIGYRDHNSEWGCGVKTSRDGDTILVEGFELYKIDAMSAYWESMPGERERHARELIEDGRAGELEHWNGLFHTHPPGMDARMSGTDKEQLIELAGQHWAISIICPANLEGVVNPGDWLVHYADNRFDCGVVVTANLVPAVDKIGLDSEKVEIMRGLMHKQSPAPWPARRLAGDDYSEYDEWWDRRQGEAYGSGRLLQSGGGVSPRLMEMFDDPLPGDWVYIHRVNKSEWYTDELSAEELVEYNELDGTIHRVQTVRDDAILAGGFWLTPEGRESAGWLDDIRVIARQGSTQAKALDKKFEKDGVVKPNKILLGKVGIVDGVDTVYGVV